jgi:hypothetical protein
VKSITTLLLEGKTPESFEESLGTNERISMVDGQDSLLSMSKVSSDAILNKLRNQLGGPDVPTIQCIIGPLKVHYALCDWGASVNIMPKMAYDCLDEDMLVSVSWCLQVVDSMKVQPYGMIKDVFIEMWGSSTLVDFLVMDMDPRQQTSNMFGAPFLKYVRATINEKRGIINMKVERKHEMFTFCLKNPACIYQV